MLKQWGWLPPPPPTAPKRALCQEGAGSPLGAAGEQQHHYSSGKKKTSHLALNSAGRALPNGFIPLMSAETTSPAIAEELISTSSRGEKAHLSFFFFNVLLLSGPISTKTLTRPTLQSAGPASINARWAHTSSRSPVSELFQRDPSPAQLLLQSSFLRCSQSDSRRQLLRQHRENRDSHSGVINPLFSRSLFSLKP